MSEIFDEIINSSLEMSVWLIGFFVLFSVLERIAPCNLNCRPSKKSMATDAAYFFVMPIVNRFVRNIYMGLGVVILFHGSSTDEIYNHIRYGYGPLAVMPIWLQAAVIFIISDI